MENSEEPRQDGRLDARSFAAHRRLSVVLVAYRSRDDLGRCLQSLHEQRHDDLEIIVVDNDPGDGTGAWLRVVHPEVVVIDAVTNGGYAGGNNIGIAAATGAHVLVLNPDTRLHAGALATMLDVAAQNPRAFVTPKLLMPDGRVNACGMQMHVTGITTCRGLGDPSAAWTGVHDVPLVSGAAFLAPRAALEALSGFDADYFMYFEDTDLSLRARLHGYDMVCAADAVVDHDYALNMTASKFYYLERNRLLTLFKVYESRTLWRLAPALALTGMSTFAFAIMKGPAYVKALVRGQAWLLRHRRSWGERRRTVQRQRLQSDAHVLREASTSLPFDQLIGDAKLATLLDRITRPIYRLAVPAIESPEP